jgi:hypothetical protein
MKGVHDFPRFYRPDIAGDVIDATTPLSSTLLIDAQDKETT